MILTIRKMSQTTSLSLLAKLYGKKTAICKDLSGVRPTPPQAPEELQQMLATNQRKALCHYGG
ncbi:MAG: hypothetical protein ACP5M4_15440 [Acidobacteriaceae bacterium]